MHSDGYKKGYSVARPSNGLVDLAIPQAIVVLDDLRGSRVSYSCATCPDALFEV